MSAKNLDKHNRFRSITVGFRVSPEENEQINRVVAISGLSKQEYCYRRCMNQDIIVHGGNPKVFKALKNNLADVLTELKNKKEVSDEMLEIIRLITETLREMKGELNE
jgi:ribosomal protein S8